ncbi:hypothetical protein MIND_00967200 [Mycena indigotica]|uniref:Uncharacterized protein n=1 Tax=Mycena indigotica TaxID=2126181 RepID=A0A8H6SE92_9AGAR|nr:uncharacterized protein MIND_00967200 [Mycena indigotica]KAF7297338.1 hypothetical protein MIND_00967200 [Mycena indigotica]
MLAFKLLSLALQSTSSIFSSKPKAESDLEVAYYDPKVNGGSMLDNAGSGGGEPLNVIISGHSSPEVLTDDGFLNYAQAIGFSFECLHQHLGDPQSANLGDGNGWVNQTIELRWDFGSADIGTCLESLVGGNHFRRGSTWLGSSEQSISRRPCRGPSLTIGEYASNLYVSLGRVSQEEDVFDGHTIVVDGYTKGRDLLVAAAVGKTTHHRVKYRTTAQNITNLLPAGSEGVNHGIATDGVTVLLTVTIT